MEKKKMTQRDYFNRLLAIPAVAEDAELVEFIEGRIAQLDKKNSAERKPTAKQIENAGIKDAIVAWMEHGRVYAAGEVAKTCPACEGAHVNKVSALLTQLAKDGVLTVSVEKRKSFYALPA